MQISTRLVKAVVFRNIFELNGSVGGAAFSRTLCKNVHSTLIDIGRKNVLRCHGDSGHPKRTDGGHEMPYWGRGDKSGINFAKIKQLQ